MARRTITECDRCRREISALGLRKTTKIIVRGNNKELCQACGTELAKFLAGENLEVPP